LKSELVNIFASNQQVVVQHFQRRLENGAITLGLPKANIK